MVQKTLNLPPDWQKRPTAYCWLNLPPLAQGQSEVWIQCLSQIGAELKPSAIVLGNDTLSQEMTPRLAHRLGGASIGDAQALSAKNGRVCVTRSVYGGKAIAEVKLRGTPAVVWVRAQSMDPAKERSTPGEISRWNFETEPETKVQLVEAQTEEAAGERLEDAPDHCVRRSRPGWTRTV